MRSSRKKHHLALANFGDTFFNKQANLPKTDELVKIQYLTASWNVTAEYAKTFGCNIGVKGILASCVRLKKAQDEPIQALPEKHMGLKVYYKMDKVIRPL